MGNRTGPRNLITDIDGILVGNVQDPRARTGVSVVLPEVAAIAAADVRGGAPGTREIESLSATSLVRRADAIVLAGGSAFGLEAASGAAQWLATHGRGFAVGEARVPIVPAAILFDLLNGGDKDWGAEPPYRALGFQACEDAATEFALGNTGAGLGAVAGTLKGGLGSASAVLDQGFLVGALVAANGVGSAVMPGTRSFWAWAAEVDNEFGGGGPPESAPDWTVPVAKSPPWAAANTTLCVVATDAELDAAQCRRLAIMAQDGIARAIRPAHTPFDGDTVFALATGRAQLPDTGAGDAQVAAVVGAIGAAGADCVERAIARAVYAAETLGDIAAFRAQ